MKAKELIEKLTQLDPEEEIYTYDFEWGPELVTNIKKTDHYREGEHKEVWTIM